MADKNKLVFPQPNPKDKIYIFVLGLGVLFISVGYAISQSQKIVSKQVNHIESPRYLDSFCIEHHLSTAETDVLKMLLQGMSNAEIAEARHVSLNTVKTHLSKIYSKSGIASRSRLLALIK